MEAINRLFAPEFRNRLDAIITFAHLSPEVIAKVVEKFVLQLEAQLADRDVTIELTDEAAKWLIANGYDELMGARPMARVIQEHIKKPLADEVLFGKLKSAAMCASSWSPTRPATASSASNIPTARSRRSRRSCPSRAAPRSAGRRRGASRRVRRQRSAAAPRLGAEGAAGQGLSARPVPSYAGKAMSPSRTYVFKVALRTGDRARRGGWAR